MKSSLPKESPIASTSSQPVAGSLQLGNLPMSQSSFTDEKKQAPTTPNALPTFPIPGEKTICIGAVKVKKVLNTISPHGKSVTCLRSR